MSQLYKNGKKVANFAKLQEELRARLAEADAEHSKHCEEQGVPNNRPEHAKTLGKYGIYDMHGQDALLRSPTHPKPKFGLGG